MIRSCSEDGDALLVRTGQTNAGGSADNIQATLIVDKSSSHRSDGERLEVGWLIACIRPTTRVQSEVLM